MKRTLIYLTLLLLVTSAWGFFIHDDFEDGNMDEWTHYGCTWQIDDGELILQHVGYQCGFTIGDATWQDYTLGVKVKIVEHQLNPERGEGAVIIYRVSMPRFYVIALRTPPGSDLKVASFLYSDDGVTSTAIETEPFEWQLNHWYDLTVYVEGNRSKLFIDGQLVLDEVDDRYTTGSVGLGIGNQFTSAHFDDFFVTDEEVPNITAVSPQRKLATTWGEIKRR